MDKRKERALNEMQRSQLQSEIIETINKINVVVPDTVKELGIPESKIEDIVKEIKFEEFGEKIKKAKAEILKASKIQVNKAEVSKLTVDFKNLYRQFLFKQQQLQQDTIIELNAQSSTGKKYTWQIRAERDMISHQLSNVCESLELYGCVVDTIKAEIQEEFKE